MRPTANATIEESITGLRPNFKYAGTRTSEPFGIVSETTFFLEKRKEATKTRKRTEPVSQVRIRDQPRGRRGRDSKAFRIDANVDRRS